MKILTYSDLHFELNTTKPFVLPEDIDGDIMILAGDILNFDDSQQMYKLAEFLKPWGSKTVLYVAGNHEYYTDTKLDIKELDDRFIGFCDYQSDEINLGDGRDINLLQNDSYWCIPYQKDGVCFFGGTMWTDLEDGTKTLHASLRMNDYNYIKHNKKLLQPEDTITFHNEYLEALQKWLKECDKNYPSYKRVVISHHCPIHEKTDYHCSAAYVSTKTRAIIENPDSKIDLWVYGHTHNRQDYMIGNTRIISNPYGYVRYNQQENFDPYGNPVEL